MEKEHLAAMYQRAKNEPAFNNELSLKTLYTRLLNTGDVAVDVGVYSGRHLFAMAECVNPGGYIYGFEPIPGLARLLSAEARIRNVENIVGISEFALADFIGDAAFHFVQSEKGYSGLKRRYRNGELVDGEEIEVKVTTLDTALPADAEIKYIKLDIEGGELWALRGAQETIKRCRPMISLEIGESAYSVYGITADEIAVFFYDRGYRLIDILGNIFTTPADFLVSESLGGIWDYIAVHEDDARTSVVLETLAACAPKQ